MKLAAKAGGVFGAVACHLDLIGRQQNLIDDGSILAAIDQFPETLFDQHEQIIVTGIPNVGSLDSHNRNFNHIALVLTCSGKAGILNVAVLAEASRFNVPQGEVQVYNLGKLEQLLLGCFVKVTRLRRKPRNLFPRHDDAGDFQQLTVAHFAVKELFYRANIGKCPARDFALSNKTNQRLGLKIVFHGLQQFLPEMNHPTKYDEHCIKMTERAISKTQQFLRRIRRYGRLCIVVSHGMALTKMLLSATEIREALFPPDTSLPQPWRKARLLDIEIRVS